MNSVPDPPRCFPEYGSVANFNDDCTVDINDLRIVAGDWCKSGQWAYPVLPETNGVIQYTFDEGSGTIVHNTGTWGDSNGYDLTIGMSWDVNGDPVMEPNNDPAG
ncbi:MAG: hypothetical protein JSV82_09175 [Planctomycetota bacterium]|nr:MAG: hypothetical protein JSV82_09175 [Planctomycetota bacterium]